MHKWNEVQRRIHSITVREVRAALLRGSRGGHPDGQQRLHDFMALVSPAAAPFLEEMASLSRQITLRRFGRTMQLYIPVYLSNACANICTYCGFSANNRIRRVTLNDEQILQEARAGPPSWRRAPRPIADRRRG